MFCIAGLCLDPKVRVISRAGQLTIVIYSTLYGRCICVQVQGNKIEMNLNKSLQCYLDMRYNSKKSE